MMDLQQKLRNYENENDTFYVIPTPTNEISRQVAHILSNFGFRWNYYAPIRIDDEQFLRCVCIYPSGVMWGDVLPNKDDPNNWAYKSPEVNYELVTPQQFLRVLKDINARGVLNQV